MAKVELKTKATDASVEEFISRVDGEQKRADAFKILELMKKITGEEPRMWGPSMIGFGEKVYRSPATGREVDFFTIGFAPRKSDLTLYVLSAKIKSSGLLEKLGPHKTGQSCLYIKRLSDIDEKVLTKLVKESYKEAAKP